MRNRPPRNKSCVGRRKSPSAPGTETSRAPLRASGLVRMRTSGPATLEGKISHRINELATKARAAAVPRCLRAAATRFTSRPASVIRMRA